MGKKHFCFFQTAETGTRTPNSGVKGSGANHYPRAPALVAFGALPNLQLRQRRWVTVKFLRHKRGGLKNLIQLYRTDTSQDQLLFRIRLVGQK